ncbi:Uncharacterised protein [Serratia quinivorans]|nr:Uncharacterised protein [Serratia quinivorans]
MATNTTIGHLPVFRSVIANQVRAAGQGGWVRKKLIPVWVVSLPLFLMAIPLFIVAVPAFASTQYAFVTCGSASAAGTWCRDSGSLFVRRDGLSSPLGATLTFTDSGVQGRGYVPPDVTYVTPTLQVCSGAIAGDCKSGQSTRSVSEGTGWSCTPGEAWSDCMNRAVGTPAVLEGQFLAGENGACLIFRDQKGGEWSTNYYGYACGKSKLPPPTPDNCAVTSLQNWDIAFGNLERSDISDSSSNEKTKDLTLTCTGKNTHDFSVKLNMTATSW